MREQHQTGLTYNSCNQDISRTKLETTVALFHHLNIEITFTSHNIMSWVRYLIIMSICIVEVEQDAAEIRLSTAVYERKTLFSRVVLRA